MIQLLLWCPPMRPDLCCPFDSYYCYTHCHFWPDVAWLWGVSVDQICCFPVPLV